jgi:DNA-binding transcriptional regulator YhcF (GntR family)
MYQTIQSTIKTQGYEPHKKSINNTIIQFKQLGYSKSEILETLLNTYKGFDVLENFIKCHIEKIY